MRCKNFTNVRTIRSLTTFGECLNPAISGHRILNDLTEIGGGASHYTIAEAHLQ
jgi:hypothetical protein